jgi:hypothetical protein
VQGGTQYCHAHGGGTRCQYEGCTNGADVDTQHCVTHGGGRRCQKEGCTKAAQGGGTQHCVAHGGGKRCEQEGCTKPVARAAGSVLCTLCLRGAAQPPPDDAQDDAPQHQPSEAQAPQAMAGIETSFEEFQEDVTET